MDSFSFRPKLTTLESRDTPSATPTEVLNAFTHTQQSQEVLQYFQNDLTMARTSEEIKAVASFMTALANQSAIDARMLGDYSAELAGQLPANPALTSHAGLIASAQTQALLNTHTAHFVGLAFGAAEAEFHLATSPVPPPPPPPPPNPTVTTPVPPVTTNDAAGMTETPPAMNDPRFVDLGDGVKFYDVVKGTGTPVPAGGTVKVFYTLWLAGSGEEVQTNRTSTPFSSPLTGLIVGWQEAIPGMQPGGIRRLFIPAAKGYGANGSPPDIPPNADLVFEVKLLAP